jgi:putative sugar O-methyltransferase
VTAKPRLADHAANVYSQFGEDGILARIFELIGTGAKACVEFGAWDGFHLSNTANLWAKQGWKAVLIEADAERHAQLLANTNGYDCHCICARVEPSGANTLEAILQRAAPGLEIDLLSIDVDGDDYFVLASLDAIAPRVIVCEYNPTIPPHLDLVPKPGNYFGSSALALVRVAEQKGYRLVAVTDTNCFFVRAADFAKFAAYETSLPEIAVTRHLTYLMTGYAGDYVLSREPTYGLGKPSAQEFDQAGLRYAPQPREAGPRGRRLARWWERLGQWARFGALAAEVQAIYGEWDKAFAPAADAYLHPLWREAQPAFAALLRNGLPRDFLRHPAVAQQFCRQGFGPPQQHELAYLSHRAPALRALTARLAESPIGCPRIDCRERSLSANTLGMLYYFARIAERIAPSDLGAIVEFGGGYGGLCRVFLDLLPRTPTYVIVDLPEMLAMQYVYVQASSAHHRTVPHFAAPFEIVPGAVNLVPVSLAAHLDFDPDLFVSTFALSETPRRLQQQIADGGFFASAALYLVGQEIEAELWKGLALDSSSALRDAARRDFADVQIEPYHFASAWELFARRPRRR